MRLRPNHKDHVWSYDFVAERTSDGRALRMLNVIDEYTRECLAIRVDRKITANDVVEALTELFVTRGTPLTYDRTMDRSLLQRLYDHGSEDSVFRHRLSNLVVLGKTDTSNHLMGSSETNCLTERSLIQLRRRRLLQNNGEIL